jgi:hypothetical protein
VLVHGNPSNGRYDSITSVDRSGTLEVGALPSLRISAAQIFL